MFRLLVALVLVFIAVPPEVRANEAGGPKSQGPQLPTWQSGWYEAIHAGDCLKAERDLAEGRSSNEAAADTMEAVMLRDGLCRPADPGKAEALFNRAIGQRYVPAMTGLAWGYLGHGLVEDSKKARFWSQRAALLWNTFSTRFKAADELLISGLYLSPNGEVPDWWPDDLQRITMLAIRGEDAKADNADRIEAGDGFLPDSQAACLWRIDAVKSGSSKAAVALGDQLAQGRGVPTRPDRAAYWWNMFATPPATTRLGTLLIEGAMGVPADPNAALILLAHAKRRGEAVDDKLHLAAERSGRLPTVTSALLKEQAFSTNPPWNHPDKMDCW